MTASIQEKQNSIAFILAEPAWYLSIPLDIQILHYELNPLFEDGTN